MSNAVDVLRLGIAIIILAATITLGFLVFNSGMSAFSVSTDKLAKATENMDISDLTSVDKSVLTGAQTSSIALKYKSIFPLIIATGNQPAGFYDASLIFDPNSDYYVNPVNQFYFEIDYEEIDHSVIILRFTQVSVDAAHNYELHVTQPDYDIDEARTYLIRNSLEDELLKDQQELSYKEALLQEYTTQWAYDTLYKEASHGTVADESVYLEQEFIQRCGSGETYNGYYQKVIDKIEGA